MFPKPIAKNAQSAMTPPNTIIPCKLQCVGQSGPANMISAINKNCVATNAMESHEWDASSGLVNEVTIQPSLLRSS
jgi:hypothetical protein